MLLLYQESDIECLRSYSCVDVHMYLANYS